MSRRRKARLDLTSPALDAIHMDNTIPASDGQGTGASSPEPQKDPQSPGLEQKSVVLAPARPAPVLQTPVKPKAQAQNPPKPNPTPRPILSAPGSPTGVRSLSLPDHPLSFRLGITDARVIATAEALAAAHGADPVLVLKRFLRDGLKTLKARLAIGDVAGFAPITTRPEALAVLSSTTRIDRAVLDKLKIQMDPLDLFASSAILGFALDQILTEQRTE